jgi:hypothetical protein
VPPLDADDDDELVVAPPLPPAPPVEDDVAVDDEVTGAPPAPPLPPAPSILERSTVAMISHPIELARRPRNTTANPELRVMESSRRRSQRGITSEA